MEFRPRRPSPLGRKPARTDLAAFEGAAVDDILPADGTRLNLLIAGINPSPWTAAVNAPFAHPGNRFWPSLHAAGLTDSLIDASAGLPSEALEDFARRRIGLTNLVSDKATARAAELSREELRSGGKRLVEMVGELRPKAVAIVGITAFRDAFRQPKAVLGQQAVLPEGWPEDTLLWVVPQPSGLNAHETVASLAEKWREVWEAAAG